MTTNCNGNCRQGRDCDCGPARGVMRGLIIVAPLWIVVILLLLLTGCTAISHKPPPSDWPKLERITKQVSYWELQKMCGTDGIIVQCHGWAWIDFNTMTCTKYFHTDDEYGRLTLEHEEEHCQGKDHVGGSFLSDLWERFKRGSAMK